MFAQDRDLLVLEPALLRDIAWASQRTIDTTATLAANTLTITSGSLEAAGVDAGSIILFDSLPIEVIARLSPTQATVSLLRATRQSTPIPPPPGTNRPCRVYTFAPQIALAHRQVLAMIAIDPDAPEGSPAAPTAANITNPHALARLETLAVLHLIYAAAATSPADPLAARAALYRQRLSEERQRTVALLDLDNDGIAETTRRPNTTPMHRA
jgi:hypothetical protein